MWPGQLNRIVSINIECISSIIHRNLHPKLNMIPFVNWRESRIFIHNINTERNEMIPHILSLVHGLVLLLPTIRYDATHVYPIYHPVDNLTRRRHNVSKIEIKILEILPIDMYSSPILLRFNKNARWVETYWISFI